MKYRFRRGWWFAEEKIEVTRSAVKLFRGKGKAVREIAFADVAAIHGFSNMSASNESGERFETHMCTLVPKKGRAIVVCSSSFIVHGSGNRQVATDNSVGYVRFIERIMRDVANANPDAVLIVGNRTASIGGGFVTIAAVGMLALTFSAPFSRRGSMAEMWPLLLVGGLVGLVFAPWGIQVAKAYSPVKVNLRTAIRC